MFSFLEYLWFVIRTKGLVGGIIRAWMLVRRFDISGRRMGLALEHIANLGKRFGYKPALMVPAVVLRRHPVILDGLLAKDLELAIHGYTHRNFKPLSLEDQVDQIRKAKDVFLHLGVQATGFRTPYLSRNQLTEEAVRRCGLRWNSDVAFMAERLVNQNVGRTRYIVRRALQRLYDPADAAQRVLLPWIYQDLVCIPILLPDDEILVDRLGIRQPWAITHIWHKMLRWTIVRGELFVLQLHPERFFLCQEAMEELLNRASSEEGRTWIAGMDRIADWWISRYRHRFTVMAVSDGHFEVSFDGPQQATVVGLNMPSGLGDPFYRGYRRIDSRQFRIQTGGIRPVVGIHPCHTEVINIIRNIGFAYEQAEHDCGYAIYFSAAERFQSADQIRLLRRIEACGRPIVRCWPWPGVYRSAFTTTHDLDSLTLMDFVYRLIGK